MGRGTPRAFRLARRVGRGGAEYQGLVPIPAGSYTPFQRLKAANTAEPEPAAAKPIAAFIFDVEPVTNAEFLAFVESHPEWRKSRVKALFVDGRYLRRWSADLELANPAAGDAPVTDVSWFAAQAFCKARGLRLPTTEQWEDVLADAGRGQAAVRARSLDWFAKPNGAGPGPIGGPANGYGIRDLIGLVWEWTYDFNAYATTAELRDPNGKDNAAVCGGAAAGVSDPDRLSRLDALRDAREPQDELHRGEPRLPLRRRRAMTPRPLS